MPSQKRLTLVAFLALATATGLLTSLSAHATVWWPEVAQVDEEMTVYKDYQDPLLFYYVPKAVTIATGENGVKMINQEIFFNRLTPARSATQYNLTFEPILGGAPVQRALIALKVRYGAQAQLVPMPVTTTSFEVTQKFDAINAQYSAPFSVFVPNWTGDLHSFNQRFSAVMIGNAYASEPAMSRFIMNPAGNGFVGTMHYGFRGIQVPFKGHATINVSQFVSSMKAHLSASVAFWASADISAAVEKIKDDRSVFIDVVRDDGYESEVWKSLVSKLIDVVFQPVPTPPTAPAGSNSGFAFFKISAQYESVSVDRKITIDLTEAVIKDRKGDIDIAGGGVRANQLSSNLKYLCDMWAKYDVSEQRCVDVCAPATEYYNPSTRSCAPAFGGN